MLELYRTTKMVKFLIISAFSTLISITSVGADPIKFFSNVEAFQTPSKNIFCVYFPEELRCDIQSFTPTTFGPYELNKDKSYVENFGLCTPKEAIAFVVSASGGKGKSLCPTDSAINSGPILNYGTQWNVKGLTCLIETKGVTCTNKFNHGFFLSRNKQDLF